MFTLGVVGGDAMKAVFLARQHQTKRTEAVASVIVDRMLGLFALFIVVTVAFFFFDFSSLEVRNGANLSAVKTVCRVGVGATAIGTFCIILFLLPGFTNSPFWDAFVTLPKVGPTLERLIATARIYRRNLAIPATALLMSLGIHALNIVSFYLIALGLPGAVPTLGTAFVIIPIAILAGAVPLPGGLGSLEFALDFLYRNVTTAEVPAGQGFVIALGFRVVMILIASIGMVYYVSGRKQVNALMKQAESEEESGEESV